MTRQEAIEILNNKAFTFCNFERCVDFYTALNCGKCNEALSMAIKALEQIESGRYIKGECSICSKEYGTLGCCTTVSNHWVYSCKEGMAQYVEALEQEPKIGHWIYDYEYSDWFDVTYECSCCKRTIIVPYEAKNKVYKDYPYCYCGAKMEVEK